MSAEPVTIKVEPPDDFSLENKSSSPGFVVENGDPENSAEHSAVTAAGTSSHDMRNFTCLLCEVICESRDELRRHLKTYHASKHGTFHNYVSNLISPEAAIASLSTYMSYRYTCSLCGAKFRSLRSYLSHNMSHRSLTCATYLGSGSSSSGDENGVTSILNTGKQYLQDYFESDDGYSGTFTCTECNTVFTQRDSYAMHMMMRAMNESCQHAAAAAPLVSPVRSEKTEPEEPDYVPVTEAKNDVTATPSPTNQAPKHEIPPMNVQQKCLEDVTSSVDQDEYLKSVLDKVLTAENAKHEGHMTSQRHHGDDRKVCKFCGGNFLDQDSLAMHVMSDHSEEMAVPKGGRTELRSTKYLKYSNWLSQSQPLVLNYNCKYCGESFMSRDSLAMHVLTHAHQDGKKSDFTINSLKRPREYDHDILMSESQRAKILRRVGQFNHLSFLQRKNTEHNIAAGNSESERLYCGKCNITFYLRSEYEWHARNYHETRAADDDVQPLCLTKPSSKLSHAVTSSDKENDVTRDITVHTTKQQKIRRNSFSYDKIPRARDLAPKRPLSADDCAALKAGTSDSGRSHCRTPEAGTNKSSKLPNSNVLPNLEALSSNEQRIIFSVFGKNLKLNGIKGTNKQSVPDNNHHAQQEANHGKLDVKDDIQSLPADLSVPKSPTTPTSGDTMSSEPTSSTVNVPDPVVANDQDGRHPRMLNSELDAPMCKYCDIVFFNKAIYYLHMGLHNVNNPWQCNVCGKCCNDAVDFAAHVIHM